MRVSPMPGFGSLAQRSADPLPLSSMPPMGPGPVTMVPIAPLAPMAPMMAPMGIPTSMSLPQPLMSGGLPPSGPAAQAGTTTNPFLL